jgi:hypothetical protein
MIIFEDYEMIRLRGETILLQHTIIKYRIGFERIMTVCWR